MNITRTLHWLALAVVSLAFTTAIADGGGGYNTRPVADPGPSQTVMRGDTVMLDGSGSYDDDGDPLTYHWTLEKPEGSDAVLSDQNAIMPTFVADVAGEYTATLIVNDGKIDSWPCDVKIVAEDSGINIPPVADAGTYEPVTVPSTVQLDGSGSSDPDGDDTALMFMWTLTARPDGSSAELFGAETVNPTFEADVAGTYEVELVVRDEMDPSVPDTATIEAFDPVTAMLSIGDIDLQPTDNPNFAFEVTLEGMVPGGVTVQYIAIKGNSTDESFLVPDGSVTFEGTGPIEVELAPGTRFFLPSNDEYVCVFLVSVTPADAPVEIVDELGIGIIRNDDPTDDGNTTPTEEDCNNLLPAGSTSAVGASSVSDAAGPSASASGAFSLLCLAAFVAWRRRLQLG
jgi:hypothetical protein